MDKEDPVTDGKGIGDAKLGDSSADDIFGDVKKEEEKKKSADALGDETEDSLFDTPTDGNTEVDPNAADKLDEPAAGLDFSSIFKDKSKLTTPD